MPKGPGDVQKEINWRLSLCKIFHEYYWVEEWRKDGEIYMYNYIYILKNKNKSPKRIKK